VDLAAERGVEAPVEATVEAPVENGVLPSRADGTDVPVVPTISEELGKILGQRVIHGLDAVRALAVTMVLIDHFELFDHLVHKRLLTGSMGVMVFFVLSGFLITSMLLKEYGKTGSISLRDFYRRRAFRIFPSFYVSLLLISLLDRLAHNFRWKPALFSFFYMTDYFRALHPDMSVQFQSLWIAWSLAIEEKFYLLWPLLLLLMLRKKPARLAGILSFIILGQWIYRAILYLGFRVSEIYLYNAFDMRIDALLIGCLLAILLSQETTRSPFSATVRSPWMAVVPTFALVAIILFPATNRFPSLMLWTVQPIFIAVLLLQFIFWGEKSWSFCRTRVVKFLAQISYALYLYHPVASKIVYFLHLRYVGYTAVLLTFVLAPAAYYGVERPFMRMRDKGHRSHSESMPVGQAVS
jgi:peptidoglycan/LPS O-acetylase OafA/YrhL